MRHVGCRWFAVLGFVLLMTPAESAADMRPARLRCEYLKDPLGVDVLPRLSWILESNERGQMQTAYQVLVASSQAELQANKGDLWDTGKVESSASLNIEYAGKPLGSGTQAFWKVRAWDNRKNPSAYSEPAWWEMGLLHSDGWKGKWISDPRPLPVQDADLYGELPVPMFRKEFTLSRPVKRARSYVSGLGYCEMSLNGRRVGDRVLDPAWTSYDKRVLHSTYDVTDMMKDGVNAVGIMVGNGWYNPLPMRFWGWLNLREHLVIGRPRAILQLYIEYADGTVDSVATDETWRVGDGPILKNNIYLGEVYDARKEVPGWDVAGFDDRSWVKAEVAPGTVGNPRAELVPPIRQQPLLKAKRLNEPSPGTFIFDMGQNLAGWVTLRVRGDAGSRIQLRYGELLHPDGTLNVMTSVAGQIKKPKVGGPGAPEVAWQSDVYICKGGGEESYTPRFTWHGFRYVEVTGYPGTPPVDAIVGHPLRSDVESAGSFACSNDMFNRIQEITRWSLAGNMISVQSDCPARERFGYGGDIVATSEMAMLNFDMASFYAKVVTDLGDAVRPNGGLTETAPFVGIDGFDDGLGGGAGPIGWGTVHPLLLWQMRQYYGDTRLMVEQYDVAKRWLALLDGKAKNMIIDRGIGDHESLAPKLVPLTSTAFYYLNADMFSRIARVLGRGEDADRYADRAASIKVAFNQQYLDRDSGRYGTGTQACQAFAIALGLTPGLVKEKALSFLLDELASHKDSLTTGIFGTRFMLMALSAKGHADVAYRIVNRKEFPGWGHMLANDATTLWEHWEYSDNTYSHNHPMFGSVSEWFFKVLGGIQPQDDAVGFDRFIIHPRIVAGLTWVKSRYDSIRGPIVSEWRIEGKTLKMRVVIPANTKAVVYLPMPDIKDILEGDRPVQQAKGLELRGIERDSLLMAVGSGEYRFSMPWTPQKRNDVTVPASKPNPK